MTSKETIISYRMFGDHDRGVYDAVMCKERILLSRMVGDNDRGI